MIDFSTFGWPQWLYVGLVLTNLVLTGCLHGKPRSPHNVGTELLGAIIAVALLTWGGFFA